MKKFLSLLLTLVMLLALIPATESNTSAAGTNLLNVSTTDLHGNAFSGSTFGEYDFTLLNVWATWCGPCLGEMPYLQQIYTELEPRGINIVGVLFDSDNVSGAIDTINANGLTYTTVLAGTDETLTKLANISSLPTTYFINRSGNVCENYTHVGSDSYAGWLKKIVAVMYWEYGIEMTDLAPLPDPTVEPLKPFPTLMPTPVPTDKPVADATYTLDETGTLTISGTAMADYRSSSSGSTDLPPWYEARDTITNIVVEEGITYIGTCAFQFIPALESVTLPSSLRYIGELAFMYSTVTNLVIPEGVTGMGQQYITCSTISLPSTLVNIPNWDASSLFCNCQKLTSITVAKDNPVLCSVDGVLYTKDKKTLLCYPSFKTGDEFTTLPETVILARHAFMRTSKLKKLNLSKNINVLHSYSIYSNTSLKGIYFYGDRPDYAASFAIIDNVRLVSIYYPENAHNWESSFFNYKTTSFVPVTTLLGDVNGDTFVTQTDALLLLRTLAGWTTTIDTAAADINGDTSVTQTDALLLLRYLAGWPVAQFPA